MSRRSRLQKIAETIDYSSSSGHVDDWLADLLQGPVKGLLDTLFKPELSGWENLDLEGGALIVANHSGGGATEILAMTMLFLEKFGREKAVSGMAHPLTFFIPPMNVVTRALGAVPSTYQAGLETLRSGVPLLIFPGGEYDAFRPVWNARKVDFNGRKGFLRLAREANVPIIPLGIWGSHFTNPIFARSSVFAESLLIPRLVGMKRVPITLTGVVGAVIAYAALHKRYGKARAIAASVLWLSSPMAMFFPLVPYPIHARIGTPIPPEELFTGDEETVLERAYDRVTSDISAIVNTLADEDAAGA